MLLRGETKWIVRRKETVNFVSESSLRHCMSLDFEVGDLPCEEVGTLEYRYVPLALLRKEPGRFTRFDFEDEGGRALPLPSRADNAEISGGVLVEAARRVLGELPPPALDAELRRIASAEKDRALAVVQEAYRAPRFEFVTDAHADLRRRLWRDADFEWLLRTLAYSSLTVAELRCDGRDRRVVKLRYDEKTEDTRQLRRRPLLARVAALGYRLGWRGYMQQLVSPFTGARTYHFEIHVPEGIELLEAGIGKGEPVDDERRSAHLYRENARRARTELMYARFRVRGTGFVNWACLTSLVIAASLVVAHEQVGALSNTTTSAPALLLLFPGLVASYFARPAHPLVSRLLGLARVALLVSAGTAYLAAGRLALISAQHPADPDSLEAFFRWLAVVGGLAALVLLLTMALPLRLNGPVRRRWRRLFGEAVGAAPADRRG